MTYQDTTDLTHYLQQDKDATQGCNLTKVFFLLYINDIKVTRKLLLATTYKWLLLMISATLLPGIV